MTSESTVFNLDDPLRWECNGLEGTEVSQIPPYGDVLFFDALGPVVRVKDCAQVRWRCILKMSMRGDLGTIRFRVTVVRKEDNTFVSAIPWIHAEVIECAPLTADHFLCEPWLCDRVGERVEAMTKLLTEHPLMAREA